MIEAKAETYRQELRGSETCSICHSRASTCRHSIVCCNDWESIIVLTAACCTPICTGTRYNRIRTGRFTAPLGPLQTATSERASQVQAPAINKARSVRDRVSPFAVGGRPARSLVFLNLCTVLFEFLWRPGGSGHRPVRNRFAVGSQVRYTHTRYCSVFGSACIPSRPSPVPCVILARTCLFRFGVRANLSAGAARAHARAAFDYASVMSQQSVKCHNMFSVRRPPQKGCARSCAVITPLITASHRRTLIYPRLTAVNYCI